MRPSGKRTSLPPAPGSSSGARRPPSSGTGATRSGAPPSSLRPTGRPPFRNEAPVVPRRTSTDLAFAPEESDYVHDEIRELASKTKEVIAKNFKRHGTSKEDIRMALNEYGVSAQSRAIMNREADAARLAASHGLYVVFRNEYAKRSSTDFCTRVGPSHMCFCGHTLAEHIPDPSAVQSVLKSRRPPKCAVPGCTCDCFRYIPNEPEEIGEHWLARRKDFVPGNWRAKCKCGRPHDAHKPGRRNTSSGGCSSFTSAFLCVVCDQPWEAHETVFETVQDRQRAGLPTGEQYFPLSDLPPEFAELVFLGPTTEEKAQRNMDRLAQRRGTGSTMEVVDEDGGSGLPRLTGGGAGNASRAPNPTTKRDEYRMVQDQRTKDRQRHEQALLEGAPPPPWQDPARVLQQEPTSELPPYCTACAAIIKDPTSKFCPKCGTRRMLQQ